MPTVKITALTAATTLTADDYIPVVDDPGGTPTTKRITGTVLKDFVLGSSFASTLGTTSVTNFTATATSSLSASRFTGTVSGSGLYRMVVPVGTNLYATT